jgi:alkylhydroperoxidase/carboxymuconolactone decarboxylase family protein YurZ
MATRSPRRPETLRAFEKKFPTVWQRYRALRDACDRSGPLPTKTRELIKIGMEVASKRHGGLIAHINRARKAGSSSAEIYQAILLASPLVGMPNVLEAFVVAKQRLR